MAASIRIAARTTCWRLGPLPFVTGAGSDSTFAASSGPLCPTIEFSRARKQSTRNMASRSSPAMGDCLALSAADAAKFHQIDSACEWVVTGGEMAELQRLGGSAPLTDIIVYYVDRFASATLLGCGGHRPTRYACVVAAQASRWDTAHEIGHVLLTSAYAPVHSPDPANLMYAFSSSSQTTPVLTVNQIAQIKQSPCCRPA